MFTSVSNRSAAAYKRVDTETSVDGADAHKLVVLLFGALQQALGGAKLAMQRGDIPVKCKHISHAVRIFEEGLIAPLNLDAGGEVAANLQSLYRYCVKRLTHANMRNDVDAVDEVMGLVDTVADGWKQMGAKRARNPHSIS